MNEEKWLAAIELLTRLRALDAVERRTGEDSVWLVDETLDAVEISNHEMPLHYQVSLQGHLEHAAKDWFAAQQADLLKKLESLGVVVLRAT